MKIIISDEAKNDITEIFDYIALDSLKYAKETTQNIRSCIHKLKDFPYLGKYVDKSLYKYYKQYRELICKNYIIVYSIYKNEIYIHFVIHKSRNISKFFNLYLKNIFKI